MYMYIHYTSVHASVVTYVHVQYVYKTDLTVINSVQQTHCTLCHMFIHCAISHCSLFRSPSHSSRFELVSPPSATSFAQSGFIEGTVASWITSPVEPRQLPSLSTEEQIDMDSFPKPLAVRDQLVFIIRCVFE